MKCVCGEPDLNGTHSFERCDLAPAPAPADAQGEDDLPPHDRVNCWCRECAFTRGREAERRDVVAWLRGYDTTVIGARWLADRIEAGKHRPTPGAAKGDGHGE